MKMLYMLGSDHNYVNHTQTDKEPIDGDRRDVGSVTVPWECGVKERSPISGSAWFLIKQGDDRRSELSRFQIGSNYSTEQQPSRQRLCTQMVVLFWNFD